MAEQVLNQFRSDKALREDCIAIYEAMGMDLNTAFRMFMERTRMVGGLPFPAILPDARMTRPETRQEINDMRSEAADYPEMALDEINAEISVAQAERKLGRDETVPATRNVVIISTERFNELKKAERNAAYLKKLERGLAQVRAGQGIEKTMEELEAMAEDGI